LGTERWDWGGEDPEPRAGEVRRAKVSGRAAPAREGEGGGSAWGWEARRGAAARPGGAWKQKTTKSRSESGHDEGLKPKAGLG